MMSKKAENLLVPIPIVLVPRIVLVAGLADDVFFFAAPREDADQVREILLLTSDRKRW